MRKKRIEAGESENFADLGKVKDEEELRMETRGKRNKEKKAEGKRKDIEELSREEKDSDDGDRGDDVDKNRDEYGDRGYGEEDEICNDYGKMEDINGNKVSSVDDISLVTVTEFDNQDRKSDDNNENLIVNEDVARIVNSDVKKGNKVKRKNKVKNKKNGRKKRRRKGKTDIDNEETEESELEGI
jgi:hypothetical protein